MVIYNNPASARNPNQHKPPTGMGYGVWGGGGGGGKRERKDKII